MTISAHFAQRLGKLIFEDAIKSEFGMKALEFQLYCIAYENLNKRKT